MWPCIVKLGKVINQLDGTHMQFIQCSLAQHVLGINMPETCWAKAHWINSICVASIWLITLPNNLSCSIWLLLSSVAWEVNFGLFQNDNQPADPTNVSSGLLASISTAITAKLSINRLFPPFSEIHLPSTAATCFYALGCSSSICVSPPDRSANDLPCGRWVLVFIIPLLLI
jgi:hypothetical protein